MRPYLVLIIHVRQQYTNGGLDCRTQQRGQGIPVGSNQSAFQHIHFLKESAATSVDRECPLIEASDEDLTISPVPVTNEIAGSLFPAAGVRDLICDPFRGRMRCDAKP